MAIVSGAPFQGFGHPVHCSFDRATLRLATIRELSECVSPEEADRWLKGFSRVKSVRSCGLYGHRRCRSARCVSCSKRRQGRNRNDLYTALRVCSATGALMWTATIGHSAGDPLLATWDGLDMVRKRVLAASWLTRQGVDGYAMAVEVVLKPNGWHPHIHTLLAFREALPRDQEIILAERVRDRWLSSANQVGVAASAQGQHVHRFPMGALSQLIGYLTKDHLLTGLTTDPSTVTTAMILRAAATGDAEAVDCWEEYELAATGRRTWQTGGMLRPSSANRAAEKRVRESRLR